MMWRLSEWWINQRFNRIMKNRGTTVMQAEDPYATLMPWRETPAWLLILGRICLSMSIDNNRYAEIKDMFLTRREIVIKSLIETTRIRALTREGFQIIEERDLWQDNNTWTGWKIAVKIVQWPLTCTQMEELTLQALKTFLKTTPKIIAWIGEIWGIKVQDIATVAHTGTDSIATIRMSFQIGAVWNLQLRMTRS